jgi:ribosomal protein L37AE/L43A
MEIQNPKYKFICEKCNYKTNRSFDYNTHLSSIRHKNKNSQTDLFICEYCEKEFKTQSGLWKHCNKCQNINKNINYTIDSNIIEKIMVEIQNKNIASKENIIYKQTVSKESNLSILNQKCKNPRDIKKIFNNIRIDTKTYMDDYYRIEYEKIIEKLLKNTFMNTPLLERSIINLSCLSYS